MKVLVRTEVTCSNWLISSLNALTAAIPIPAAVSASVPATTAKWTMLSIAFPAVVSSSSIDDRISSTLRPASARISAISATCDAVKLVFCATPRMLSSRTAASSAVAPTIACVRIIWSSNMMKVVVACLMTPMNFATPKALASPPTAMPNKPSFPLRPRMAPPAAPAEPDTADIPFVKPPGSAPILAITSGPFAMIISSSSSSRAPYAEPA